jgi:hypothetical protein
MSYPESEYTVPARFQPVEENERRQHIREHVIGLIAGTAIAAAGVVTALWLARHGIHVPPVEIESFK